MANFRNRDWFNRRNRAMSTPPTAINTISSAPVSPNIHKQRRNIVQASGATGLTGADRRNRLKALFQEWRRGRGRPVR